MLVFQTDWKGERIRLPPAFAPAMKLKGIEEIRFAPGMFQAQSDSFFSYAFVFSVAKDHELTQEVIQREILVRAIYIVPLHAPCGVLPCRQKSSRSRLPFLGKARQRAAGRNCDAVHWHAEKTTRGTK